MNTELLRDMLAIGVWASDLAATWMGAYEFANRELPDLLAARETKWAVYEDGKVVTVYDTCEAAEACCGIGRVVLPYKEPKP